MHLNAADGSYFIQYNHVIYFKRACTEHKSPLWFIFAVKHAENILLWWSLEVEFKETNTWLKPLDLISFIFKYSQREYRANLTQESQHRKENKMHRSITSN